MSDNNISKTNKISKLSLRIRSIALLFLIMGLLYGLYLALNFYRYIHQTPLRIDSAGYLVMVPPGLPVSRIAENLSTAGVMKHPQWFLWWMQITGKRTQVKAGEYLIKPGTTPQGFIDMLVTGKVVQHAITVVEGWTFDRLMQAIHEAPKLKHTLKGLSNKEIMEKLGRVGEEPEGRFFPDTYYFPANTTDVAFLQRAYRVMQEKLDLLWIARENTLNLKSPYEALILASIIEKESCVPEEYADIAGVYVRRLERNMPLQADPTVIYGLGKIFNGQLTLAHLRQPSAYNTYLNVGLPPTPISLPSQKALEAAVKPKKGEALYFVATGTDKRHVFSNTEEEHQKAVLRYRTVKAQIEKERSLAVQESADIAQEEAMVERKKEIRPRRTASEKAAAKKILQEVKEILNQEPSAVQAVGINQDVKDMAQQAARENQDTSIKEPEPVQEPEKTKAGTSIKSKATKAAKATKTEKGKKTKTKTKTGKKEITKKESDKKPSKAKGKKQTSANESKKSEKKSSKKSVNGATNSNTNSALKIKKQKADNKTKKIEPKNKAKAKTK